MPHVFYLASVFGAIAVYLMLPRRGFSLVRLGALIGLATLAGLFAYLLRQPSLAEHRPSAYYYIFTFIAVAAGVRVITHPRPVYSALYFVLVVLASAGMLVLLEAEFMAFAMVIIYGGAILITYMFVIMLATLPQSASAPETAPDYDRSAREPLMAVLMGFVLLAILSAVIFGEGEAQALPRSYPALSAAEAAQTIRRKFEGPARLRRLETALRNTPSGEGKDDRLIGEQEHVYDVTTVTEGGRLHLAADVRTAIGTRGRLVRLDPAIIGQFVGNIDRIGLNLFTEHALGIELAGVILLLSMVGAIVIARRRIPAPTPPPAPAGSGAAT